MKNLKLAFLAVLLTVLPALSQDNDTSIDLESFDEIKVFDQINVTLVKSDKNQAVVSGDDVEKVSIGNDNGRLNIKMEIENMLDGNETNVMLYHTEALSLIDANEGAEITSEEELEAKYLTLRTQEGGKLTVKVNAKNLDSKAVTGGEIKISGTAENQEVNIRSGGQYDAKDLATDRTEITIFAGGNGTVNASEVVDANVTAGGTIEIYGNPETVNENDTFGGSIIVKQ
ncbi:head GIN domain-containing protein [Pricia sp.]|uniref:head GIN domain-containing protein n=1 Tax=Pricia sp. TaxID=2268138 RepID=UPI003593194D